MCGSTPLQAGEAYSVGLGVDRVCYTPAMRPYWPRLLSTLLFAASSAVLSAQAAPAAASSPKHGMTLDDLAKLMRVGAPVVSPDGKWIAYTLTHTDVEADKSVTNLWMVSWDGKEDVQLTFGSVSAGSPRWSPDG